jgi:phosphoglucomutase
MTREPQRQEAADADAVARACRELESGFGDIGRAAAENLRRWTSGRIEGADAEGIRALCAAADARALLDEFWRDLPFGTGGRRGPVGFGPNRMNVATTALTIQGHCNYLRRRFATKPSLQVIVANDVRVFYDLAGTYVVLDDATPSLLGLSSRDLAVLACEIYAGNGIVAYLSEPENAEATLTTPELSYAIRRLEAVGGVNFSASHNHPDDNGIKLYDADGGQFPPPEDEVLAAEMAEPGEISRAPFENAVRGDGIRPMPDAVIEGYLKIYAEQFAERCAPVAEPAPLVFTPLCGCGARTVARLLDALGFETVIPPGQDADGTFASVPFRTPNPEVEEATRPARAFAEDRGIALVLSSDPDADRVGADVLVDGEWFHLTGNQIAAILTYYLLADPEGPRLSGLVVETLVTTKLLGAIVGAEGSSELVDDLLVGFKYVGQLLRRREAGELQPGELPLDRFLLAAEESHGVLSTAELREKDASSAAIYLAYLHTRLGKAGETLLGYFERILDEFGAYAETARSIVLRGSGGTRSMAELMESLRREPPTAVHGEPIVESVDFWDTESWGAFLSATDRESRNVLQWRTASYIVTVRPSGTEPKIKFYVQFLPPETGGPSDVQGAQLAADEAAVAVYSELLRRLGRPLSRAALLLPDIIALDEKEQFDRELLPSVKAALSDGEVDPSAVVLRLRADAARLTPGADPLPALRRALRQAGESWADSADDPALAGRLAEFLRTLESPPPPT